MPPDGLQRLLSLQEEEDRVLVRSLNVLRQDDATAEILELIELALDLMLRTASVPQPTEDGRTISAIAGRVFNTSAGCLREALNGYCQTSFALMRDLVEIHTLLDYFTVEPEKISRWRVVTNPERLKEFRPGRLRRTLDERDGFTEGKRQADYEQFSEYAAHLTYPALRMLQTPDGHTQHGPRLDERQLRNAVFELSRRVAMCVNLIVELLPKTVEDGDVAGAVRLISDFKRFKADGARIFKLNQDASGSD